MGLLEWTIIPRSPRWSSNRVFSAACPSAMTSNLARSGFAARPVFYLESNVSLQGGSGTSIDPYRLAV